GQRPDARAAGCGPAHCRSRGSRARVGRGRCREPAVRGRLVRRRDVGDRRHVRAPSPGVGRRARARVPPRRHDRVAELDAGRHARRAVRHHEAVCAAACARRAAAAAVGQRGAPARPLRRARAVPHARARCARDHGFRAAARVRRALQGALRADDRGPCQRRARRPRGTIRRGAGRVLRHMEPRQRRPRALREGVPACRRDAAV
ncbi:MAG: Methyltransferase type 11, partial [uncultured Solirubrobacteraceae bacterium]